MKISQVVLVSVIALLTGCGGLPGPVSDQGRWQCSAQTNANNAADRIFNNAYWECMRNKSREEQAQQSQQQQQAYLSTLQNRCSAYGFKQGSNEFANCMMQQQQQDAQAQQQQIVNQQRQRQADLEAYKAYTAPPPPMQIIQPNIVNQNRMTCSPNGLGGYNCN